MKAAVLALALAAAATAQLIPEVRKLAGAGDFAAAEKRIETARPAGGWTPETLLAHSWLGRSAQAAKQWDKAEKYAAETRRLALEMLKGRQLDDEPNLPLALGASIEVHAHTLANTGRLSEALSFLDAELRRWRSTSIRTRTQKNFHLLGLEGKPAPELETRQFVGEHRFRTLKDFRGKPVLLFLWAHWCSDCKAQGPILEQLRKEFPKLAVVAPTQRYGYVAGGQEAPPSKETPYIREVQKERYPWMNGLPMPLSEENFKNYGVSSTPTLVLLDDKGIVRMYHPGRMTAEELRPVLARWAI